MVDKQNARHGQAVPCYGDLCVILLVILCYVTYIYAFIESVYHFDFIYLDGDNPVFFLKRREK